MGMQEVARATTYRLSLSSSSSRQRPVVCRAACNNQLCLSPEGCVWMKHDVTRQAQVRVRAEHAGEQHASLESCDTGSQARMRASAKAEMRVRLPRRDQLIGSFELLRVPIRSTDKHDDNVSLAERLTAKRHIRGARSADGLHWTRIANEFFNGNIQRNPARHGVQRRIITQERQHRIAEKTTGDLEPGMPERTDGIDQYVMADASGILIGCDERQHALVRRFRKVVGHECAEGCARGKASFDLFWRESRVHALVQDAVQL
jgi:hypothetical protein